MLDAQHTTQRRIQCTHLHTQADICAHSYIGIGMFVAETRLYANTSYESRFGGEIVMCAFAIISPWKSVRNAHTHTHTAINWIKKAVLEILSGMIFYVDYCWFVFIANYPLCITMNVSDCRMRVCVCVSVFIFFFSNGLYIVCIHKTVHVLDVYISNGLFLLWKYCWLHIWSI